MIISTNSIIYRGVDYHLDPANLFAFLSKSSRDNAEWFIYIFPWCLMRNSIAHNIDFLGNRQVRIFALAESRRVEYANWVTPPTWLVPKGPLLHHSVAKPRITEMPQSKRTQPVRIACVCAVAVLCNIILFPCRNMAHMFGRTSNFNLCVFGCVCVFRSEGSRTSAIAGGHPFPQKLHQFLPRKPSFSLSLLLASSGQSFNSKNMFWPNFIGYITPSQGSSNLWTTQSGSVTIARTSPAHKYTNLYSE